MSKTLYKSALLRVDWWRRSKTLHDSMTSYSWRQQCSKSSHSETRNRVNYRCGVKPLSVYTIIEHCVNSAENSGATTLLPKFDNFHDVSMPSPAFQRAAHNRLICIGGLKLAGLNRVSFDAIIHVNHDIRVSWTQQPREPPSPTDRLEALALSQGAALSVASRPSVCPSRASDFLQIGKP